MFKNTYVKNVLSALAIAILGFILLNLTFLFDWLFHSVVIGFIKLFTPINIEMDWYWFPPMIHISFVLIIALISWYVFRSKLGIFYKAIYMTVPVAVFLVTTRMFLYLWPVIAYLVSGFLITSVLYYFYRTKQPWLYYYAVILVSWALIIMNLTGAEI